MQPLLQPLQAPQLLGDPELEVLYSVDIVMILDIY